MRLGAHLLLIFYFIYELNVNKDYLWLGHNRQSFLNEILSRPPYTEGRERKGGSHTWWAGARFKKLPSPARILRVYTEALPGLSHAIYPYGLSATLLSQSCFLEVALAVGNVPKIKEGVRNLRAESSLKVSQRSHPLHDLLGLRFPGFLRLESLYHSESFCVAGTNKWHTRLKDQSFSVFVGPYTPIVRKVNLSVSDDLGNTSIFSLFLPPHLCIVI